MSLSRLGIDPERVTIVTRLTDSANNGGPSGSIFRRQEHYSLQSEDREKGRLDELKFSIHLRRTQYGFMVDRDIEVLFECVSWSGFDPATRKWDLADKSDKLAHRGSPMQAVVWREVQELIDQPRFRRTAHSDGLVVWTDREMLNRLSESQTA